MDTIKLGEFIVVQRHDYTKLIKFERLETTITIGREIVELRNINENKYFATFKMKLKDSANKKKRLYQLELCDNKTNIRDILRSFESGADNRNILDKQESQGLSLKEIEQLKETKTDSKEIIESLVANSKTFNEKTEFSQEKYLKKKEKKYSEYIQIRKPTLRLLAHIYYRQDPEKVMGMRIDSLSQLISYAGINSSGKYLLYDAGSCGLVTASFLNAMGPQGDSKVVLMHPGNFSQKQAMFALNLSSSHMKKCIGVNIYSVLRQFYQVPEEEEEVADEGEEPSQKKQKLEVENIEEEGSKATNGKAKKENFSKINKRKKWQEENQEAIDILKEKFDSLTIVAKEDPLPILKELLPFVHPGRPIVIFHWCKEILMECYKNMKQLDAIVNLRLFSNFMRSMQVLPKRTHPFVKIQGSSGYLLVGYVVNSNKE